MILGHYPSCFRSKGKRNTYFGKLTLPALIFEKFAAFIEIYAMFLGEKNYNMVHQMAAGSRIVGSVTT